MATPTTAQSGLFGALTWRCIGPFRGGRVVAVAGDPVHPMTFYFGACAGGVWKTTDGGTYWQNVSDGFLQTAAVGAIAVADSDPNVIYVGMGETAIRRCRWRHERVRRRRRSSRTNTSYAPRRVPCTVEPMQTGDGLLVRLNPIALGDLRPTP